MTPPGLISRAVFRNCRPLRLGGKIKTARMSLMKLNQYKKLKIDSDKQIPIFNFLQAQQNYDY